MKRQSLHHVIRHTNDFLLLLILLAFGLAGLYYFGYQPDKQIIVAVVFSLLYFLWGVLHHYHEGDLTVEVGLEYISLSVLVLVVLVLFFLRV